MRRSRYGSCKLRPAGRQLRTSIVLPVVALALAACGGGASPSSSESVGGRPVQLDTPNASATPTSSPVATPTRSPAFTATPDRMQPSDVEFPGCESVMAEENYCLTTTGSEIALVGLDSGRLCHVVDAEVSAPTTSSIAWQGEVMYVCDFGSLIRISLRDGSMERVPLACEGVTDYRGQLLTLNFIDPTGSPLTAYADFEAVQRGEAAAAYTVGSGSSRLTVNGDIFVGAWHATTSVDVADLRTDAPLGVLTLESGDDWINGIALTNDGLLAVSRWDGAGGVVLVFDFASGRLQRTLHTNQSLYGLACTSRVHTDPLAMPTAAPPPTAHATPTCAATAGSDECGPYDCSALPTPERPDFPPSIQIAENCTSGVGSSNYASADASADASSELHVIGVYEAKGNPGFRSATQGVVDVVVHPRPKPVALFLSNIEPVLWRLTIEPGAVLAQVVVQSPTSADVSGVPDGVPVDYRGAESSCGAAYGWEIANGGGDGFTKMIATARDLAGVKETSFQGCYGADRFEIPYWSGDPPTQRPTPIAGDETVAREAVRFQGCEQVMAESHYCVTTTYGGLALIGLDEGHECIVTPTTAWVGSPLTTSLAWRGELLYACTEGGLLRISLRDGSWEPAQIGCTGVTDFRGGLLLAGLWTDSDGWPETRLNLYPDYPSLLRGEASDTFDIYASTNVIAVRGETLYSGWFSTDTVERTDLTARAPLPSITLQDYDGWLLGMAVTDDNQLAISGDTWGDTVRVFDATTGAKIRELHLQDPVFGLSCITRQ